MQVSPLVLALSLLLAGALPAAAATDWGPVGQALGKSGAAQAGEVYRVGLPRTDLKVTLDGVAIRPGLALGSWLAFKDMGGEAMVMGDLVLLPAEVNPVMSSLLNDGFEVTALHNHLLRSQPATMYMHVSGHGNAIRLATALHRALALSGTPMTAPAAAPPQDLGLDSAAVEAILGFKGKVNGGVLQFGIPRAGPVMQGGMAIPEAMGVAIAINLQSAGSGKVVATGDFVLTADEVNPVLRALRANGIEVTALHNHMLDDEPRIFFVHFWANGDAKAVARGLRAALEKVAVRRG
jgi:hypothetical protein